MSGLNSLRSIFQKKGEEYIKDLMESYVVVNEKIDGSYFGAILDSDNTFHFYKKGGPITFADRVLNRFYNKAISHFESLSENTKMEIPNFYLFSFQYFPNHGKLVLSHIHEMKSDGEFGKTLQTKPILDSWAETLGVDKPSIIFEGYLSDLQKNHLLEIINSPEGKYDDIPFEKNLLSIFGVNNGKLDAIVFRFYESEARMEEKSVVAKLVSPSIEALTDKRPPEDKTKYKSDDFMWIILIDLMNFTEKFSIPELKAIPLSSANPHIRYVELINSIYKKYITEEGNKWEGLNIQIPEYLNDEKFDLNTELITDSTVKSLVEQSQVNKEIYRILLNMFRNPNAKVSSRIFSESMRSHLKSQIEKLSVVVQDKEINEDYFPTFIEFLGQSTSYSIFEDEVEEVKKNDDVNIVIDYFQPINKSHIKVAQKLYEENGNPSIFVAVSQIIDTVKYPIDQDYVLELLNSTKDEYPNLIAETFIIPTWSIESIWEAIRLTSHIPTLLACTTKRIKDYAKQIEYYNNRTKSNCLIKENFKDVKLVEVDQNEFGDKVRLSIIERNEQVFKKLTPKSIHNEFKKIFENYVHDTDKIESSNQVKLEENFKFLKMVINDDSSINVHPSIFDGLNVIKKKLDLKDNITNLIELMIERKITKPDAESFMQGILNDSEITNEDIINLEKVVKKGIQINTERIKLIKFDALFEKNSINIKILDKILSYRLEGYDNAGIGEFAAALLFKNAIKLNEGDVSIRDEKIEIKNNESQLLSIKAINENSTFVDSSVVLERKLMKLKEIVINSESKHINKVIKMIESRLSEKKEFNINQKGIRNYVSLFKDIRELIPEIKEKVLYEWFINLFWGGILSEKSKLDKEYRSGLFSEITDVFESGKDAKRLLGYLTYVAFKYYSKVDNFTGMMVFRNNHDQTKHSAIYIPESIEWKDYYKYIEPVTGPSLSDPRTSKSFKIRMRPLE